MLALEPLAILIRADREVRGILVGPIEEKLSLYADNALIYLADASASLKTALHLFDHFSGYSGIHINWDKSVLFPLHPSPPRPDTQTQLKWVDELTYLGISSDIGDYMGKNIQPLMSQITTKCVAWRSLPLTPVGRVNLLKMVYLPKFLYFFRNTPSHIPKSFFRRLEGLLVSFVWAGKPPRVARKILYLPLSRGGLALPNFQIYYWAAVLVTVHWWFSQPRQNPAITLEAATLGSYAALSNLVFWGASRSVTTPMKNTIRAWQDVRVAYRKPSPCPLIFHSGGNLMLPHFLIISQIRQYGLRGGSPRGNT